MGKIQDAIKKIAGYKWISIPFLPAMDQYVSTGDEAALKKITPLAKKETWWAIDLPKAMRPIAKWEDEDRRLLHGLIAAEAEEQLWNWLDEQLPTEKPGVNLFEPVRQELESFGKEPFEIAHQVLESIRNLVHDGRPTSVGRFLLSLSATDLQKSLKKVTHDHGRFWYLGFGPLTELMVLAFPDRIAPIVDELLKPRQKEGPAVAVVLPLLKNLGDRFLPNILAAFEKSKDTWGKFHVAEIIYDYDPKRFHDLGMASAIASLSGHGSSNNHGPVGEWLVMKFKQESVPAIVSYFQSERRSYHSGEQILTSAGNKLGKGALPIILAALDSTQSAKQHLTNTKLHDYARTLHFRGELELRQKSLQFLIALEDPDQDERIETELRQSLTEPDAQSVVGFLNLVGRWKPHRMEADIWGLLEHKSRPVRGAAARALARLGDAALPKGTELLKHKKADVRGAAVTLLSSIGTDTALSTLEARLDEETNDDVRDEMLLALAAAWEKQGRVLTRKDIEKRIKKAEAKLAEPPAPWADPAKLPPLFWKDSGKLSREAVAYLLYRQSRQGQIRSDVEAAPMYRLIDRASSGDFARAILKGFIASKQEAGDRWALALVGLFGGDGLVPELTAQIRDWVDHNRGKLAEYAVQALALMGSDVALVAVDAMAIRYRSKMKNVGRAAAEAFVEAAEKQGITPEELGDRVVPWLGFEPHKQRIIKAGNSNIEASIGLDLKLSFKDLDKNKPIKSLPKTAAKEVLTEFKDLSANLREIVKSQVLRLENLLVRQRRWPAKQWKELFLHHPLLLPFAARLVWGHYDERGNRLGTFRALEDRTLTTHTDDAYALPDSGVVGMIHPLEFSDEERTAWQNHLVDYEVEPPFPQMERQVVRCTEEQSPNRVYRDLKGIKLNGMTFKGRAERLGWYRGSVCDGGGITSYYKTFPASGADVFLALEGFYIGIDMHSEITLGVVNFVKNGSVKVGSYTYDEPSKEDDPRLLAMGEVPALVFSEVLGDLRKIAGKKRVKRLQSHRGNR